MNFDRNVIEVETRKGNRVYVLLRGRKEILASTILEEVEEAKKDYDNLDSWKGPRLYSDDFGLYKRRS